MRGKYIAGLLNMGSYSRNRICRVFACQYTKPLDLIYAFDPLALVDFPVLLSLISQLQKAILGIVPLATFRAWHVAAYRRSTSIILRRNRERRPATAWDEVHLQIDFGTCMRRRTWLAFSARHDELFGGLLLPHVRL